MNRLENKVALVTHGSVGTGNSACFLLAREGAKVAVTDILDVEGRKLVSEINILGRTAEYWHLDVTNEENVKDVIEQVRNKFGRIDILVNNAGISDGKEFTKRMSSEDWDIAMSLNVQGIQFCTKYVIPYMKEAEGGSIINISSVNCLIGNTDLPPYYTSNGEIRLITRTNALNYANDKIRVNSIHPGFINTPMNENFLNSSGNYADGLKELKGLPPLGHLGQPEDIGYGIVYLASDESKFITGRELVIDGGYSIR